MPPFDATEEFYKKVNSRLVELPLTRKFRYKNDFNLPDEGLDFLVEELSTALFFEELVKNNIAPKTAANWILGDVQAQLKRAGLNLKQSNLSAQALASVIKMVEEGRLAKGRAKEVIAFILKDNDDPENIVKKYGFEQVQDSDEMNKWIQSVLDANPDVVEQAKQGNHKVTGFLVGQVMKMSGGKANPKLVKQSIIKELNL
jgi:aspartyl-tRNA(Asn)/glutamyl-tRNA(Gln) amidotransferase subunit B